ncbi:hypothetical protein [Streptomyces sp. NPDC047028]|uniref:hypothetical protein n=1 Tax=Streptomyces sp. NPDC047028 TaxID=3155793 RepID=UPI003410B0C8
MAGAMVALATIVPAAAEDDYGRATGTAKHNDNATGTIGAQVKVRYSGSTHSGHGSGALTSADSNWTPPGCWYAPTYTSAEFRKVRQSIYFAVVHDPDGDDFRGEISDENQKYAKDEYHDGDKGRYWAAVQNPDAPYEEQWACDKPPFWVPQGKKPPVKEAVSPEILAGLAYQQIQVPGTRVSLAPAKASKVNLPTWVWLDKGRFKPVSVTASLSVPGFSISATTTATPSGLTIEAGTDDADLLPSSGTCPANSDGSIGREYTAGSADETPPCGVTYLRSSGDGTFDLRATATWKISWKGSDGTGGDLPDGQYGRNQAVKVREVQAVNR